MTLFLHELKKNKLALIIWSAAVASMLGICIIIYPEMAKEMDKMSELFANMGSFSDAFGLDKLNFGEFTGYFAIECGNVLGIGGAIFAAIVGVGALASEERDRTSEFLLSHPVTRTNIVLNKLVAVITQLLIFNLISVLISILAIFASGVEVNKAGALAIIFVSYFIMQIEIAAITFGISGFVSKSGLGIGIGVAMIFYCLNIVANLSEDVKFLRWLTPFAYTDGGYILEKQAMDMKYLVVGIALSVFSIAFAFLWYRKKDIK